MRWSVTLLFYLSLLPQFDSISYIFILDLDSNTTHQFCRTRTYEAKHVEKGSNNNSKKIYCTTTTVQSIDTDRWTNTSVKANQKKKRNRKHTVRWTRNTHTLLFSLAREPNRQANIKIHVSTGWNFTAFYSIDTSFMHTRPQTTSLCFEFFFFFLNSDTSSCLALSHVCFQTERLKPLHDSLSSLVDNRIWILHQCGHCCGT